MIRSNIADWSPEDLWRTYIQITEAEAAFRIQKSELAIRPIWHQREDRVKAHILFCFLAYVLWTTLEEWQHRAGPGRRPNFSIASASPCPNACASAPPAALSLGEM